jgi:polygalacturonase
VGTLSNLILQIRAIVSRVASTIPIGVAPPTAAINLTYTSQTFAALLAAPVPSSTNILQRVLGRTNPGDCNLPLYRWDANSVAPPVEALILRPNSISGNNPGRYIAQHEGRISVRWFGAVGDGSNDDGAAIATALAACAGQTLVFPKGRYRFFQMPLVSNTTIEGEAGAKIEPVGGYGFILSGVENITIKNLEFVGTNEQIAVFSSKSRNITVQNCKANCRLFAGSLQQAYSQVTDADLTKDVKILTNTCTGTNKIVGDAAIYFIYCDGATADNNVIENYAHGIAWWGGGANHNDDGALSNPRKTKNIKITNNKIKNIGGAGSLIPTGGGIWGSMGDGVTVKTNLVENCHDVGIDSEGSRNVIVSGNIVKDCEQGCLATFFFNQKVIFSKNICTVSNPNYPLWRNYNSSLIGANSRDISFTNNKFYCTGSVVGRFDCGSGPCSLLEVSNNVFENVYIDLIAQNMGAVTVKNNKIITTLQADNRSPIAVGGVVGEKERICIKGNEIESIASQPVGTSGIFVNQNDPNAAHTSMIDQNYCYGFLKDIICVLTSPNASIGGTFIIRNNIGTSGTIEVSRAINAGVNPVAIKDGNIRIDGVAS